MSHVTIPSPDDLLDSAERVPSRWAALTDSSSKLPTYGGIVAALAGFVLLLVAWAKVAGETDVWRQVPYIMSAGLPGLGLIMVGLVIINITAKRQDAAERARQMAALTDAMVDLQRVLERPSGRRR